MKIIKGLLLFWVFISPSFANDAAEATAAVLDVVIQKYMDSTQVEAGLGTALAIGRLSPELHVGVNNYFFSRYKMGAVIDVSILNKNDTPDFNIGAIAGIKNFNPLLGRHFINLSIGASKFVSASGIYFEPSISFSLKESSAVKYFWIMHTFGVNASVAYRHIFVDSRLSSSLETSAVLLRLNVFMGQRERKY